EHDAEGPVEAKVVERVFIRVAPVLNLRVRGRDIQTTAEHPFYVRDKGWKCAKELAPSDQLLSHDGRWVAVEAVADTGTVRTVYNLRVSGYHTYFVGCQEWGFSVWAHNAAYELGQELEALGHNFTDNQVRAILAAATRGNANPETIVFNLRKALTSRQIFLN